MDVCVCVAMCFGSSCNLGILGIVSTDSTLNLVSCLSIVGSVNILIESLRA